MESLGCCRTCGVERWAVGSGYRYSPSSPCEPSLNTLREGSIGPITEMAQFKASIGHLKSTTQGVYVACLLLSAAFSALASGHVSDRISRKYGMLTGGLIVLIGTIISACSPNLTALFLARLLTGVGVGQAMSIAAVYLVEIPPAQIRGRFASLLQLYIVAGIAIGYFIPFGSRNLKGDIAWRTPFIFQAALSLIYCCGLILTPRSPRWLCQKGRLEEARVVLEKLRLPETVEKELNEIEMTLAEDQTGHEAHFMKMFQPRYLKRTLLSVMILVGIQTTGVIEESFRSCAISVATDTLRLMPSSISLQSSSNKLVCHLRWRRFLPQELRAW